MAHIAVTGGAGFIGSCTAKALHERGHKVTVLDNLSLGHRAALSPFNSFIHVDLANALELRQVFQQLKCDGVIHFAAYTQVAESAAQPGKYWQNNLVGTQNLLEAMNAAEVKKLVFSSTAAVYGNPSNEAAARIREHINQVPINTYGRSKKAMELLIESYCHKSGPAFSATALRYFNACGWGEDHSPESHLIPRAIAAGLGLKDPTKGYFEDITIFGQDYETPDGTCIRDYIDVRDLANAHILQMESQLTKDKGNFDAINVGSGLGYSVKEVIAIINAALGDAKVVVKMGERREGDPAILIANSDKLQSTGWTPKFSLKDSVNDAVAFMRKYPYGYEHESSLRNHHSANYNPS